MMENDFDKIGKKMPYAVPAKFFDTITEQTLAEAERRAAAPRAKTFGYSQVLAVAASISLLLTLAYVLYRQPATPERMVTVRQTKMAPMASRAASERPEPSVAAQNQKAEKNTDLPNTRQSPHKTQEDATAKVAQQPASQKKAPETVAEILASVSDEELLLLATIAETDLQVYEHTF